MKTKKNTHIKKQKKKKFSWKIFMTFIIFEIIFTGVTAPLLVFYGPFNNVKKTIVGAAMTTLKHQYIATTFLSKQQIDKILNNNTVKAVSQDSKNIENLAENIKKSSHDSNIERYSIESSRFKGDLLIIDDPLRVKVGYSSKLGKEGQMTTEIAREKGAVAAINGGGFVDKNEQGQWIGTGGNPRGLIMSEGKVIHKGKESDDDKSEVMGITKDGVLVVGEHSLNQLKSLNVREAISFGPALVVNGKGTIPRGEDGGWGIAPRTAIGQRRDGSIILVVIDGRQPPRSYGATLKDVQDIMIKYEAYNATNLDGGSSTTMYYDGEILNNPSDPLGERAVPSIVYVQP